MTSVYSVTEFVNVCIDLLSSARKKYGVCGSNVNVQGNHTYYPVSKRVFPTLYILSNEGTTQNRTNSQKVVPKMVYRKSNSANEEVI